ncbi:MAG: hypothetical protein A2201_03245 [Alicyclobacillus sp. RIFOXYA1_FULL_53_8]|nr:MAG: hypothetical protein A2201_03245 [Alicyclobacillus sp. RIFOXYA1_FULL_53_8]
MFKTLIVSFGHDGLTLVENSQQSGLDVRVLDCFDVYHAQLLQWYGKGLLQTQGRRIDVRNAVAREGFDLALVYEDTDFVRTALITQSLREGGVGRIIVITRDASRRAVYRRCGANRVVVAESADEAWNELHSLLPSMATA